MFPNLLKTLKIGLATLLALGAGWFGVVQPLRSTRLIAQKPREVVVHPVISNRPSVPSVKLKNVKGVHEFYANKEGYLVNPKNGKLLKCLLHRDLPQIKVPKYEFIFIDGPAGRINVGQRKKGYMWVTFGKGLRKDTAYAAQVDKPGIVHRSEIGYLFPKDNSIKYTVKHWPTTREQITRTYAEQFPGLTVQKGRKFFYYKNQETGYCHIPRPEPQRRRPELSEMPPLIPGELRLINPVDRPIMARQGGRSLVPKFYRKDLDRDPASGCLIDPLFNLPIDGTTSRLLDEKGLSIRPHTLDHKLGQDQLISYPTEAMNKTALFKKQMERSGRSLEHYEIAGHTIDQSQKYAKSRVIEYQNGAFKSEAVTMADIANRLQNIYEHISAIGVKLDDTNYGQFTQTLQRLSTKVDLNRNQVDSLFSAIACVRVDLAKLSNLPNDVYRVQQNINELQRKFNNESFPNNEQLFKYQRQIAQEILNIEGLMRKVAEEGEINFSTNQS